MEKKKYSKPTTGTISLLSRYHLAAGSPNDRVNEINVIKSRDASVWDDEEEEENTGGWFQ